MIRIAENISIDVIKEHLNKNDLQNAVNLYKHLYKGNFISPMYFLEFCYFYRPSIKGIPCFELLNESENISNELPGKILFEEYLKSLFVVENQKLEENLKLLGEILSASEITRIYAISVREKFESLPEIQNLMSEKNIKDYKNLNKIFDCIYQFIEKSLKILVLISDICVNEIKEFLNLSFRPVLSKKYVSIPKITDFAIFSNIIIQIYAARDRIKVSFLTMPRKLSHNQNDILEFLLADFLEVHEIQGQILLKQMLNNEISVFLQMLTAYLDTYKFPQPDIIKGKYDDLINEFENNLKPDFKKKSMSSSMSNLQTAQSTNLMSTTKKSLRESYLRVYPATPPVGFKESKNEQQIKSKTSFKTVQVNYAFHSPSFLLHDKQIKFEIPHRISFFTNRAIQLWDNIFDTLLSDSYGMQKLICELFNSILWYINKLHEIITKSVNGQDSLVPYTKVLKFLADILMIRIRLSQYLEHLKYKNTLPLQQDCEINSLFEECQISCHNMQAELHKLINQQIMAEMRQKIEVNIEEQKWLYPKEYLTSLSWQIAKNRAVPNVIKNPAFMKIEEERMKTEAGARIIAMMKQEIILMTPTTGLLAMHNFIMDVSDKFFIIGVIYESRSSLILLTRIIRQSAEEVFSIYYGIVPSRLRNKQYAYDLNVFAMHLKFYINHFFYVYLSLTLLKATTSTPDNLDCEFINEIMSIMRIHKLTKTISLVLSIEQLQFVNLLDNLQNNADFATFSKSLPPNTTAVFVEEKKGHESPIAKNPAVFFSRLNPASNSQSKKLPVLVINSLYEYLVKYVFLKRWKAPADILKAVLSGWRKIFNSEILGDETQKACFEEIDEEALKMAPTRGELIKLAEEIKKIVMKEKRFFLNKRALPINYAIPINAASLQADFIWDKLDLEKIGKSLQELSAEQVKNILMKRHEVCGEDYPKLRPDEELVRKRILEAVAELNKKIN